jgi:hypothetical protein
LIYSYLHVVIVRHYHCAFGNITARVFQAELKSIGFSVALSLRIRQINCQRFSGRASEHWYLVLIYHCASGKITASVFQAELQSTEYKMLCYDIHLPKAA